MTQLHYSALFCVSGVVGVFPSADLVVSLTAKSYWIDHSLSTLGGFIQPTSSLPPASVGLLSFVEAPEQGRGARTLTAVRSGTRERLAGPLFAQEFILRINLLCSPRVAVNTN